MSTRLDIDTVLRRSAAVCVTGAAAIHFGVAGEHFAEWWPFGVFFVLLAGFQLVWAVTCWQPARRAWLYTGAAANAATLVLWLITRTTGLPFGPQPFTPEAFGVADLVCGALEAAGIVLAVAAAQRMRREAPSSARPLPLGAAIVAATAVVVLAASGAALAAPGESGGMNMAAAAAPTPGSTAGASASPMPMGGDPGADGGMGNGNRMEMPNLPDVSNATAAQTAAAQSLLDQLKSDTAKYSDIAAAEAAGFDLQAALKQWSTRNPNAAPDAVIAALHVPNAANRTAALVDPTAPQYLIYRRDAAGHYWLIGVMFTAEHRSPPAVDLPYLRWHFHTVCVAQGGTVTPTDTATCAAGTTLRTSGYMAHVWFVQDADLRYAFAMTPPMDQLRAAGALG